MYCVLHEKYASFWYSWLDVFTNNEAVRQTNSVIHYYCMFSQQDSNSSLLQLIPSLVPKDKWITWSSYELLFYFNYFPLSKHTSNIYLYFNLPVWYFWIFHFSFVTVQNVGNSWLTVVCLLCRSTNDTVEMYKNVSWPNVFRHERERLLWIYIFIERLQKHIKKRGLRIGICCNLHRIRPNGGIVWKLARPRVPLQGGHIWTSYFNIGFSRMTFVITY